MILRRLRAHPARTSAICVAWCQADHPIFSGLGQKCTDGTREDPLRLTDAGLRGLRRTKMISLRKMPNVSTVMIPSISLIPA